MNFKTLSNRKTVDLVDYVKAYLNDNPDTELLVGCDSQNYAYNTTYATVVALYKPKGGAHVLFNKEILPLERVRQVRLMNEVWKSIEVAELLKNSGLPQVKYIDIDINADEKYKSNIVLTSALGLIKGLGYEARYKNAKNGYIPMVTYFCDVLVK
jgi:predicted RNase H-related nuclease YkuK (DUF458 family)